MYRCKNCGCRFDEPKELSSSWEAYYGISGMFDYSTPRTAYVCPECNEKTLSMQGGCNVCTNCGYTRCD
jgi:DNA-directed RNA polymerase subunit RPC12/RpoP